MDVLGQKEGRGVAPPPPGGVAPKLGSEKVSRYMGVYSCGCCVTLGNYDVKRHLMELPRQSPEKWTFLGLAFVCLVYRERKLNTNLFLRLFGHFREIPAKSGIARPKVSFPWVSKDMPNFLPPTRSCEDPHPTRRYPDQKVWVWVPSLKTVTSLNKESRLLLSIFPKQY